MALLEDLKSLFTAPADQTLAQKIYDLMPEPIDTHTQRLINAIDACKTNEERSTLISSLNTLLDKVSDTGWTLTELSKHFNLCASLANLSAVLNAHEDYHSAFTAGLISAITTHPKHLSYLMSHLECLDSALEKAIFIREFSNLLNTISDCSGIGFIFIPELAESPTLQALAVFLDEETAHALDLFINERWLTDEQRSILLQLIYMTSDCFYSDSSFPRFTLLHCDKTTFSALAELSLDRPSCLPSLAALASIIHAHDTYSLDEKALKLLLVNLMPTLRAKVKLLQKFNQQTEFTAADFQKFATHLKILNDNPSNLMLALLDFFIWHNPKRALKALSKIDSRIIASSPQLQFFQTMLRGFYGDPESAYTLVKVSSTQASQAEFFTQLFPGFNIFDADRVYKATQLYLAEQRTLREALLLDPITAVTVRRHDAEKQRQARLFSLPRKRIPSDETVRVEDALAVVSPTAGLPAV